MSIDKTNINKVKVGKYAGFINHLDNAIAVGYNAGYNNQGINSIAIGYNSSAINSANSIVIGSNAYSKLDVSNLLVIGFDASNSSFGGIYGINLDNSELKLGINTNNPEYTLDVSGEMRLKYIRDCNNSIGSNGQLLSSTISGIEWITGSGGDGEGDSNWDINGTNDIYNNNIANVGIGTDNPQFKLDVNGIIKTNNHLYIGEPASSSIIYMANGASGDAQSDEYGNSVIETRNYGSFERTELLIFKGNDAGNIYGPNPGDGPDRIRLRAGSIVFDTYDNSLDDIATEEDRHNENIRMYIDYSGNVGIGTSVPQYTLDVNGDCKVNGAIIDSTGSTGSSGQLLSSSGTGIEWITSGDSNWSTVSMFDYSIFNTNGGNVGIGTNNPQYTLDVSGSAKFTNIIDTTSSSGNQYQILTSYGDNNSYYWDDPTWSNNGSNIYNNNIDNVGIGTNTPQHKLDVNGSVIIRDSLYMNGTDISDVSGIYFKDGSYIGHGNSFDIRSPEIIKINDNSIVVNTNGSIGIGKIYTSIQINLSDNDLIRAIKYNNFNNSIYIGGNFSQITVNGISSIVNNICQISLDNNTVNDMNGGITEIGNICFTIAIDNSNNVYVGGNFGKAGELSVNRIAKWDGSSWFSLGDGLDSICRAIAIDRSNNVYVGGDFTNVDGSPVNRIAKWNGLSWSSLGINPNDGLNGSCYTISIDNNDYLYVGGIFTLAGGSFTNYIAKWDGSSWTPLGTGLITKCYTIAIDSDNNVYAGGEFTTAGGISANRIAKWDGFTWSALGSGLDGLDSSCFSIAIVRNNNVYVGGVFTSAGGVSSNSIAKWNGLSWSQLGDGLTGGNFSACLSININNNNNDLYIGGDFTTANNKSSNKFAILSNDTWNPYYLIDISGNLAVRGDAYKPGGGSWSSISDIRMKTDIRVTDNTYLMNIVKEFPLYRYKWNDEYLSEYKNQYTGYQYGTIAQELVELSNKYPELKGSFNIIETKINNKLYNDFHIVDPSQYIYIMMGAVKELLDKNTNCWNDIQIIKNDINKLSNIQ